MGMGTTEPWEVTRNTSQGEKQAVDLGIACFGTVQK